MPNPENPGPRILFSTDDLSPIAEGSRGGAERSEHTTVGDVFLHHGIVTKLWPYLYLQD